jgi:peptidyl-prolyl cis-trans isomerase SurA
MEVILQKLKAGESYDKSGTRGLDLGMIGFQKLSPQLQEVLKEMNPGEFTPVLDTDQGFQIFFVQDILETKGKSLEEASAEIERRLYEEIVDKQFSLWLGNLRNRSYIKIIK